MFRVGIDPAKGLERRHHLLDQAAFPGMTGTATVLGDCKGVEVVGDRGQQLDLGRGRLRVSLAVVERFPCPAFYPRQ